MNVAIDVRMLGASGIGTYLRHLLPRLISLYAERRSISLATVPS
jgi:hypothetical protein